MKNANSMTKKTYLKQVGALYWKVRKSKNYREAVRLTELVGKHIGMFRKHLLPKIIRIQDMSEPELEEFIARLEKRIPALKSLSLPTTASGVNTQVEKHNSNLALNHPPP